MSGSDSAVGWEGLLDLLAVAGRLKRVPRSGWVRTHIDDPESVADHSYRLALLALILADREGLDPMRSVALALIHDLAEADVGDRYVDPSTPDARDRSRRKGEVERAALMTRLDGIPERDRWLEWFDDYRCGRTREAQLVRSLDKLEMALTALDYEWEQGVVLDEFWQSAEAGIEFPAVGSLFRSARARRPEERES